MHYDPSKLHGIRPFVQQNSNTYLDNSVGMLGQNQLKNDEQRRGSVMKKKGGVVETSWIGTAWEKKNPRKGNPSVNDIKKGLQDASI